MSFVLKEVLRDACVLQHKSGNGQPGVKVRQWSLPYILTSGVTAASIYFLNLGAHIWMGTREWVSPLAICQDIITPLLRPRSGCFPAALCCLCADQSGLGIDCSSYLWACQGVDGINIEQKHRSRSSFSGANNAERTIPALVKGVSAREVCKKLTC